MSDKENTVIIVFSKLFTSTPYGRAGGKVKIVIYLSDLNSDELSVETREVRGKITESVYRWKVSFDNKALLGIQVYHNKDTTCHWCF